MIRESINITCFFGFQKIIAKEFEHVFENKENASSTAFITSGLIAGLLTAPTDLIKTNIQAKLDSESHYTLKRIKAELIKEHGKELKMLFLKSSVARMLFMGCLLGTLGTTSTMIPNFLPPILYKNDNKRNS